MTISVIVPTYKPKDYLWECLNSLKEQTLTASDWELILVLNGCCEPYYSQIRNYIESNMAEMNVVFLQTDTPGVSNARNIALDHAKGEYVSFIDDDDYISPQYLQELLKAAAPDTVSLSYPFAFNDGQPELQLPYSITNAYEHCASYGCGRLSSKVRKFFSGPCMKLIPMSFIQDRRYDVRFANGEDSLFMFLISDRIKRTSLASRKAVYYRRVRANSANFRKRPILKIIATSSKLIYEFSKTIIQNPLKYDFLFYCTRIMASFKTMLLSLMSR